MYQKRQEKLMNYMKNELGADMALLMSPINIYYYTGFLSNPHERFFVLAIDAKNNNTTLYLPSLDENAAKEAATVNEFVPVFDHENGYEKFKQHLNQDVNHFCIEKNYVTVEQYEQIGSIFHKANFSNIEPFIVQERLKKSADEITKVKKAIHITEEGLKNTLPKIKVGMTELQVKAELEYELKLLGADNFAFDSLILSGKNSALPHGVSGTREIQQGDFLLFDFGIFTDGYCSDITRTFIIGEGTEKQIDVYQTVLEANEKAIEAVKVGNPLKVIDIAARDVITNKGYGAYFTHRTGHGMGLDVHEAPSIHNENEQTIETGLLFTIEPGIYIPEIGGVRIEDDIYINENGEVEVLSSFPKQLTYI